MFVWSSEHAAGERSIRKASGRFFPGAGCCEPRPRSIDCEVDFLVASVLRNSLLQTAGQSAFRSQLDFDLNETVAESDRTRMKATYFTVLPELPALHAYLRTDDETYQTNNRSSIYDVGIGIVGRSKFTKLEPVLMSVHSRM
jgi:hypothetical protein